MENIDKIRGLSSKLIIGIETGNTPARPSAIAAEVKGHGDDTVFNLLYYTKRSFPEDLQKMLVGVAEGKEFNDEDTAGINFLILHHLASLYGELLDEADLKSEDIHLVGLKCMEMGGNLFPNDPASFSKTINCIVASQFTIDIAGGGGISLPVVETILKQLVAEMIEKFELGDEAREAVCIALLANESLYYEKAHTSQTENVDSEDVSTGVNVSRGMGAVEGYKKAILNGRFFFPD